MYFIFLINIGYLLWKPNICWTRTRDCAGKVSQIFLATQWLAKIIHSAIVSWISSDWNKTSKLCPLFLVLRTHFSQLGEVNLLYCTELVYQIQGSVSQIKQLKPYITNKLYQHYPLNTYHLTLKSTYSYYSNNILWHHASQYTTSIQTIAMYLPLTIRHLFWDEVLDFLGLGHLYSDLRTL